MRKMKERKTTIRKIIGKNIEMRKERKKEANND